MKAYEYDDKGYYTTEVECPIDPLETELAGHEVYILPANATYLEPLEPKEGYKVRFVDDGWIYEAIPQPQPQPTPEPTPQELIMRRVAELKAKLSETDYIHAVMAEGDADEEYYAGVISNRKAWRAEVRELENKLEAE